MDNDRFGLLARHLRLAVTRRSAVHTLLGPLTGALALIAKSSSATFAGKSRQRRRRRRRKKRQCTTARECREPRNSCLQAVCEARTCVEIAHPDGLPCGDGRECRNGECVCPEGVCVQTVRAGDLNGWDIALGSEIAFVPGPETPPLGTGSVRFSTVEVTTSVLSNQAFADTAIGQIETLGYSTFMVDGGATGVALPRIRLEVLIGSGGDTDVATLVFDPANTEDATVIAGEWQTWDALGDDARWSVTDPIPGLCEQACLATWAQIRAAIPNATILGGLFVELNTGTDEADGAVSHVDALRINDVGYDFELDA